MSSCERSRCDCKEELDEIKGILKSICCILNKILAEVSDDRHRC